VGADRLRQFGDAQGDLRFAGDHLHQPGRILLQPTGAVFVRQIVDGASHRGERRLGLGSAYGQQCLERGVRADRPVLARPSLLSMPSSTNRETARRVRLAVVPKLSAISVAVRSDLVK
jgi:hypothetical protein